MDKGWRSSRHSQRRVRANVAVRSGVVVGMVVAGVTPHLFEGLKRPVCLGAMKRRPR